MNYQKISLRLVAAIAILAVLSGCATATATPTAASNPPANTPQIVDQQATVAALGTQVAGTVIAGLTQNAPTPGTTEVPTDTTVPTTAATTEVPTATTAPATSTPTLSPTPTATNTPAATNTPVPPTLAPTATFIPWTATPSRTATLSTYNCTVTDVSPAATASQKTGADFDGRWVIKNTGSLAWNHTDVDIKYLSGTKFQVAGESAMDMKTDVAAGASVTVIVDMIAPADAGTFYASWALVQGSLNICNMNLTVVVVK